MRLLEKGAQPPRLSGSVLHRIQMRPLTFPKVAARLGKSALVTFSDWDGIILVPTDGSFHHEHCGARHFGERADLR
jgi:hypothetical protein